MKRYLQAWAMCRSMFCAIPCPWRVWEEKARPLMLSCLPVLGLELGVLWYAVSWLLGLVRAPAPITALVLCVYPCAVTGAIHLDGFMDVVDAVRSCADRERRREILKDPHVGSFAVIGCAVLLLAGYAVFSVGSDDLRLLILMPAVSRCGSALAVTLLRPMSTSQYATQDIRRQQIILPLIVLAAALTAGFLMSGYRGFALVIELAAYALALARGYRALGGMNGDVAGYCLSISELIGAAAMVLL